MVEQVNCDGFHAPMHDTLNDVYNVLGSRPRSMAALVGPGVLPPAKFGQRPHQCVLDRIKGPTISDAPYRVTTLLKPTQACRFPVYARSYWNAPGIYIRKDECYEVSATGEWQDNNFACGPDGSRPRFFRRFYGKLRRAPEAEWFTLLATVGDAENPGNSNELTYLPTYRIGGSAVIKTGASGYIYFYTNDMTGVYGNNRGSVQVTMRRLSDDHPAKATPTIGRRLLNAWDFAGLWVLSTAALSLVLYAGLLAVALVSAKAFGLGSAALYSWHAWLAGYGAFFLLVALLAGAYSWFYGRSDTRVEFVEAKEA